MDLGNKVYFVKLCKTQLLKTVWCQPWALHLGNVGRAQFKEMGV